MAPTGCSSSSRAGRIRVVKNGTLLATPFLDLSRPVSKGGEQGLLGLAFHPAFKTNRKFYVNYTDTSGDTRDPRVPRVGVQPGRRRVGLGPDASCGSPSRTRTTTAAMLAFGPDGYLYIGMGDGGSGGDPGNRAQSTDTLLGKMLRIDVNGTTSTRTTASRRRNPYVGRTGLDEIWQRGLRNPWRFSFDRANGNLWIGDVGQGRYEEVDRAINTSSGPGQGVNWGWRVMEGRHCYNPSTRLQHDGQEAAAGRVHPRRERALRRDRRLRLPGVGDPGARAAGTCSATTAAARSGRSRAGARRRPTPVRLLGAAPDG